MINKVFSQPALGIIREKMLGLYLCELFEAYSAERKNKVKIRNTSIKWTERDK
jgi:hypothetical protein